MEVFVVISLFTLLDVGGASTVYILQQVMKVELIIITIYNMVFTLVTIING